MQYWLILCMTCILIVLSAIASPPVQADTFSVQLFGGTAYNFRTPLVIRQDGQDTIRVNADYDTKAFDPPMYYAVRLGWWKEDRAWEVEMVHHKLTLQNGPPEVEHFSVTHGYNLLTVNRAWKKEWFIWRLGAGVIITHPESDIRGSEFEQNGGIFDGYYISGPTVQIAVEKRISLWKGLFASLEGKFTASWARVPVKEGSADVPNAAVHGLLGLGYEF
jgi:hypothetical protein